MNRPSRIEEVSDTLHSRNQCLLALVEDPQEKRVLTETLDIPRSTLDDIVRELENAGLVEYIDGKWQATFFGGAAIKARQNYLSRLEEFLEASSIFDVLNDSDQVDWCFLAGAEVYEPEPEVPDSVVTTLFDNIEQANTIKLLTPTVMIGHSEQILDHAATGDEPSFEVVLPPEVKEWFETEQLRDQLEIKVDLELSVVEADISFSFGLAILDAEKVILIAFTQSGIAGLLINDSTEAVRWGERVYSRVKQGGKQTNSTQV